MRQMAKVLKAEGGGWLEEAVPHIREGKLIVFPTGTVYGIGVNLEDDENLRKLSRAKVRDEGKPIALMAGSYSIARGCFDFDEDSRIIAERFFPGPLTLILKRGGRIPPWFFPELQKIGLRIPDNQIATALLKAYGGPLAVTSANISGSPPATNFKMALFYFANEDDLLIIDGGETENPKPSTVAEIDEGKVRILRQGPISAKELEDAIGGGK
jgi:L-threonylcarbamoyladenylate synthase